MPKPTDIRIVDLSCQSQLFKYRTPVKFGGRVVEDAVVFDVHATVETRDGRRATGLGSMSMGNAWSWPSAKTGGEDTLRVMLHLAEQFATQARDHRESGHPLDITQELATLHQPTAEKAAQELGVAERAPKLAQLVAASPVEAAIHDAYGKVLGESSYNLLGPEFANHDLAHYLNADFGGEYLDRYTLRAPKPTMPLYHLVGALDPLTEADLPRRMNDGLPETLGEWIAADELTHLKIKLAGDDLPWDVERVVGVERVAVDAQQKRGCSRWSYSLDFNEKCSGVEYVLDFLRQLEERAPAALARVQYIEQPTHRDLKSHPENRMHAAARIKPVVIDESLVDLESLLLCRELGLLRRRAESLQGAH